MPRPPGKGGHRGWTDPTAAAMGVREVGFVFSRILCIRDELLPRPQSPWTNFDPVDEFAPCPRTINAVGLRSACVPVQSPFCNHQRLRERVGDIKTRTARPLRPDSLALSLAVYSSTLSVVIALQAYLTFTTPKQECVVLCVPQPLS